MAGYSGTPLPQKLGIKPGARLGLFDAPEGFDATLGALPADVKKTTALKGARPRKVPPLRVFRSGSDGGLDVALFFTTSRSALEKRFTALAKAVAPAGSLWISWPKKSSGKKTDLDENVVRAVGLAKGLVDVKVCAVDETWSGLKFVVRLKDRP